MQDVQTEDITETLAAYCVCAANLYGVASEKQMRELLERHGKGRISKSAYTAALKNTQAQRAYTVLKNGSVCAGGNPRLAEKVLSRRSDERYYTPDEAGFLPYADASYYEKVPETEDFRNYLMLSHRMSKIDAEQAVAAVMRAISRGEMTQYIVDLLPYYGFKFADREDAARFFDWYAKIRSCARMWVLCGYTPKERAAQRRENQA